MIAKQMFTQGFSGFLRRRLSKQHFERQPLLETLPQPGGPERTGPGAETWRDARMATALGAPAQAKLRLQSAIDGLTAARRRPKRHDIRRYGWQ